MRRNGVLRARRAVIAGAAALTAVAAALVGSPLAGLTASAGAAALPRQAPGVLADVAGRQHGPLAATATKGVLLALGDSLAAGYQPTDGRSLPPVDTATGLPDQGYPGSYPSDLASRYGLRLIDLACPGETTESMTSKPAQRACATLYRSELRAASQLAAALRFLAVHRHEVRLVTIDLGANDLDGCATTSGVRFGCLKVGETHVVTALPAILRRLVAAVHRDDPGTHVVAMNYYDPYLALAYRPGGATATAEATASLAGLGGLDATLLGIDTLAGVLTADVSAAFHSEAVLPIVGFRGTELPRNVATVCQLTWMCPAPGSPVRADVHPRTAGYRSIAQAFVAVLARHHVRP